MGMANNSLADLSLYQLKKAVAIREKIDALQIELHKIVGDRATTAKNVGPRRKRKMSAAAKAKISAAAKARWAKFRAKKAGR
jgi:chorismate mutase